MRVAAVQLCSNDDLEGNLAAAEHWIEQAVGLGAEWVALPENFAFLRREGQPFPCAQGLDGDILGRMREQARRHGIWLLAGTFPEKAEEERVYNTSTLLSPEGEIVAVYRKIHLFDVDLRDQGGGEFLESKTIAPGSEIVTADTPFGGVGLSVCYDLRFPELYREMASRGVRFLTVPSAFARETGRDHWEVLLRARAIENQAFVVAPAQWGPHSPDRQSHGRALIADPWGVLLGVAPDRPGLVVADCDLEQLERIRGSLPALRHRRL
ncbi:MAG: carbon-nitrogen hydrolase family protein [Myxococcota bacterium]|nr:carbon-nitrogen hydrolase family protein [Myxococcota bacterium]